MERADKDLAFMLRYENDLFLDDVSLEDAERELGVKIVYVNNDGYEFVNAILGGD